MYINNFASLYTGFGHIKWHVRVLAVELTIPIVLGPFNVGIVNSIIQFSQSHPIYPPLEFLFGQTIFFSSLVVGRNELRNGYR